MVLCSSAFRPQPNWHFCYSLERIGTENLQNLEPSIGCFIEAIQKGGHGEQLKTLIVQY